MAQLPTGVSIVTAADEEGPIGCTVNSFMSLSADPPAVLVSLAQASRTLTDIVRTGGFGVNVLSWGSARCAGASPGKTRIDASTASRT